MLLVGLLLLLVGLRSTPPLERAELSLLDVRFLLRSWAAPPLQTNDVVVVGWDSATGDPPSMWLAQYAALARAALEGGARVVGLDAIPSYATPEGLAAWVPLAMSQRGKLVGTAYLDVGSDLVAPAAPVVAALGADNLALANLPEDPDGVIRTQMTSPLEHAALGRQAFPLLAPLLVERAGKSLAGLPDRPLIDFSIRVPIVLLKDVGKADFRDKVVIIGSLARADKDVVETPLSLLGGRSTRLGTTPKSEFGVIVQAQSVATLLAGGRFWKVPAGVQWGVLVGLVLGVGLLARWAPGWLAVGVPILVLVGYTGFTLWVFVHWGWWLDLALPLLGVVLAAGLGYYLRQSSEVAARTLLRSTISRYVSEEVMEEMLSDAKHHLENLTTQREITVLFSDINDFSTYCEREQPQDVARWLDEHYREMCPVIFAEHGTVIRFVGDQFMVLFGAPRAHPEPEKAAVRTALRMVERLGELEARGNRGFYHVKVGIHTGNMLLATVGDEGKSEYTAIGDAANLAARIQDLCKRVGCPILLSEITRAKAGDIEGIEYREMGEHEVKGRLSKVAVFTVARG